MITLAIVIAVAVVVVVVIFKSMWRVAEPNEALIISGHQARERKPTRSRESLGFKIITGKGTLVIPGVQTVRRLSLDLRQADLAIDCVTHQGIPLGVKGVLIYKVGDDFASIANSARRFLDQQDQMDQRVHNVFAGHLRAIVGNMTVEEMIRDREKLTSLTRGSSGTEMEKLGLIVDSLQIQEIDDPTGYITNLGRPHAAAVQRDARIAQAESDRAATEAEQIADALKAEARAQTRRSSSRAIRPRSTRRRPRPGRRARCPKPPLAKRWWCRRPASPSSRRSARSNACRPRCASRPTRRHTSRRRWLAPSAMRASPPPKPTRRKSRCKPPPTRSG